MATPSNKPKLRTNKALATTQSKPQPKPQPKPSAKIVTKSHAKPIQPNAAAAKGEPAPKKRAPRVLRIISADFVASVRKAGEFPSGAPEIAFVGRSNVGKSSLINALCGREALARTSKTPGRTQRINLFDATLSDGKVLRLVDLPGFGHAEVSKAMMAQFSEMIQYYLVGSETMRKVLILQDARRDRDEDAIGFARWLNENRVPFDVVATKADEISKTKIGTVCARLKAEFQLEELPLAVSARDGSHIVELLNKLRNTAYPRPPKAVKAK